MNEDKITKKISYVIYFMYLGANILPMLAILLILGVIFAYIFENDARDILKSHFQFQIRSFWIGLLYFGIAAILIPFIVGIPLMVIVIIWWIIRNVKGLKSLIRDEPVHDPRTWLF